MQPIWRLYPMLMYTQKQEIFSDHKLITIKEERLHFSILPKRMINGVYKSVQNFIHVRIYTWFQKALGAVHETVSYHRVWADQTTKLKVDE